MQINVRDAFRIAAAAYVGVWALAEPLSFLNLLPPVTAGFRIVYAVSVIVVAGGVYSIQRFLPGHPSRDPSALKELELLLTDLQNPSLPLAPTVARILPVAERLGNLALVSFCQGELDGLAGEASSANHRLVDAYVSLSQVNPMFGGWGGDTRLMMQAIESTPDVFVPAKVPLGFPLSRLESDAARETPSALLSMQMTVGHIDSSSKAPNRPVFVYAAPLTLTRLLARIRSELTRLVLAARAGAV